MKLLRTFPKFAFEFGLASWHWLGVHELNPRFATCFGDIFLESLDGWWFLDTIEGTLELRWTSAVTMYAELEPAEGRATYLMDDLVREAQSRGLHLGVEDVYTFNPHPALGGDLGADGLDVMRFELALNWVGQMHDQVLHSSGEISLPPLPATDRQAGTARVAQAWDAAWSRDETFDVPFENYLATSTFAAVARPHGQGSHISDAAQDQWAPDHPRQDHDLEPWSPAAYAAEPPPAWPGQDPDAAGWADQHHAAGTWSEQAPEQPVAGPADEQTWLDPPHQPDDWAPYETYETAQPGTDGATARPESWPEQHRPGSSEPGPDEPSWGNAPWNRWQWQSPAATAGEQYPGAAGTELPITAWEDLWGKR